MGAARHGQIAHIITRQGQNGKYNRAQGGTQDGYAGRGELRRACRKRVFLPYNDGAPDAGETGNDIAGSI